MKTLSFFILPILFFGFSQAQRTFRNPIVDHNAADPCVIKHEGYYYMVFTQGNRIEILKSIFLSNFRDAERRVVYYAPANRANLWAPEIHYIRGDLYIYFTMDDGVADANHRMYVIKAYDPRNPLGDWTSETRLLPEEEIYAIDGTVLQYQNQLYFLWTGFPIPSGKMNIYIAKMQDPMTVIPPRTLLREPTMDWEMHEFPVNEGPFFIQTKDRTFMVFSASSTYTPDYCLGIMGIDGGKDPMIPSNWWKDVRHCLFTRNDEESVFGTGHASFVRSPDDSELWMVYHAVDTVDNNGRNRKARIQKVEFEMNAPKFPRALGTHRDIVVPSGEDALWEQYYNGTRKI